jgi:hypothetical protein
MLLARLEAMQDGVPKFLWPDGEQNPVLDVLEVRDNLLWERCMDNLNGNFKYFER